MLKGQLLMQGIVAHSFVNLYVQAEALKAALAMSVGAEPTTTPAGAAGPGLPANFKGNYELFAVVTHKVRVARVCVSSQTLATSAGAHHV